MCHFLCDFEKKNLCKCTGRWVAEMLNSSKSREVPCEGEKNAQCWWAVAITLTNLEPDSRTLYVQNQWSKEANTQAYIHNLVASYLMYYRHIFVHDQLIWVKGISSVGVSKNKLQNVIYHTNNCATLPWARKTRICGSTNFNVVVLLILILRHYIVKE